MMAPLALDQLLGSWGIYGIHLLIGLAFGAVLEMAGFAHSPKLAAQFYFKDLTVLKVMFTAIVVAMVLLFLSSALGWLDYERLWVNPTFLWPGIVGGLIMGIGFIIGGFCPGTSLVALSTFRIDGAFFAFGALFGVFLFGETVGLFTPFWNSSYLGRFTLPEWLGMETGWVVVLVVAMALFMFWGSGQLEALVGHKAPSGNQQAKRAAAAILFAAALGVAAIGQPTPAERWQLIADDKEPLLTQREVYVQPGEMVSMLQRDDINLQLLDVRGEADFNLFHLRDTRRITLDDPLPLAKQLRDVPANTIAILMSNDEEAATAAWRTLTALDVANLYILEGGINGWLDLFGHPGHPACPEGVNGSNGEPLRHRFPAALGDRYPMSAPNAQSLDQPLPFTPRIKLERKSTKKGGCG